MSIMKATGDLTTPDGACCGAVSTGSPGSVPPARSGGATSPSATTRKAARAVSGGAFCLVAAWVFGHVAGAGWPTRGPARADEVVLALAAWAGLAIALWLALGLFLGALALLPGAIGRGCAAVAARITPRLVRDMLRLALGASVGTLALPTGAAAEPHGVGGTDVIAPAPLLDPGYHQTRHADAISPLSAASTASSSITPTAGATSVPVGGIRPSTRAGQPSASAGDPVPGPGWRPTRPLPTLDSGQSALLAPSPRRQTAMIDTVTVRRGDTLWSIAAAHLGQEATAAEVAREWPRWYAANEASIGDDPDVIQPGTRLVPPTALPR
jgi:hypothetical protein